MQLSYTTNSSIQLTTIHQRRLTLAQIHLYNGMHHICKITPHEIDSKAFAEIHDWSDLKMEIKKALYHEERTIRLPKIL